MTTSPPPWSLSGLWGDAMSEQAKQQFAQLAREVVARIDECQEVNKLLPRWPNQVRDLLVELEKARRLFDDSELPAVWLMRDRVGLRLPGNDKAEQMRIIVYHRDYERIHKEKSARVATVLGEWIRSVELQVGLRTPASTKREVKGKNINGQMAARLVEDSECRGWTGRQWASELKCSPSTVVTQDCWKQLQAARALLQSDHAKATHRRPKRRTK